MHCIIINKQFKEYTPNENSKVSWNTNFEDSREVNIYCYSDLDIKRITLVITHWNFYGKKLTNRGVARVWLEDFITLAYFFEGYQWGIYIRNYQL